MKTLLTATLLVALGLAGCTNGSDGQAVSYEGAIVYNGTSGGTQQEPADCGSTGTINWSMNLAQGSIKLTIKDGNGAVIFEESASGTSQTAYSREVKGAAGEWVITVQRTATTQYGTSAWSGQYAGYLDC